MHKHITAILEGISLLETLLVRVIDMMLSLNENAYQCAQLYKVGAVYIRQYPLK